MDVKQAIASAKSHARDIFDDEQFSNLGVEEVDRDGDLWRITLGLSRPWDRMKPAFAVLASDEKPAHRSYHVFTIADKDGELISARLRDR